jgi:hypothetical protein
MKELNKTAKDFKDKHIGASCSRSFSPIALRVAK